MENIEIFIQNLNERCLVPQGISLAALAQQYQDRLVDGDSRRSNPILGALVNNHVEALSYHVFKPKSILFFDMSHRQGWRMYQSSLCFMLYKALKDCYPEARLSVEHSMTNGCFCTIDFPEAAVAPEQFEVCKNVRSKMIDLQQADLPFDSQLMMLEDAEEALSEIDDARQLLASIDQLYVPVQHLGDTVQLITSRLVPSTGCLATWDLSTYQSGYLLRYADPEHTDKLSMMQETPKLFNVFQEHHRWAHLLGAPTITDLNRIVREKGENHLIHVAEALHEKKYAEVAEQIYDRRHTVKMVLLAGPSSSGKTTSCRRLGVQLSVLGFDVKQLSLDDYFVCRERTPKLPNGEFDFESVDALDIPLLNDHLLALFRGEEVKIPTFDFLTGNPYFSGKTVQMKPESILVVEGIHALNPKLTALIPDEQKFKVYVSALTQIAITDQNMIHSSDNRLIRRIVRDNNFRGWDAYQTLHRWSEVRRGEQLHIFPYQEHADVMFNSALLYELGVLKVFAEPLLKKVPRNCEEYAEASRLLDFIELVEPIDPKHIPPTSVLREFLGGSSFEY